MFIGFRILKECPDCGLRRFNTRKHTAITMKMVLQWNYLIMEEEIPFLSWREKISSLKCQVTDLSMWKMQVSHKEKVHQVALAWNRVACRQSSSNNACHALFYNIPKDELRQHDLDEILATQKTRCEPESECNYQEGTTVLTLGRFNKCSPFRSLSMSQY